MRLRHFILFICLSIYHSAISQSIQWGDVYGGNNNSTEFCFQSVVDNKDYRYSAILFYKDIIIPNNGNPITIAQAQDNGVGAPEYTIAIIKFDSKGNYINHCRIQPYNNIDNFISPFSYLTQMTMKLGQDNQVNIALNMHHVDSFDFLHSDGSLNNRIKSTSTKDKTFTLILKLTSNCDFKWVCAVNKIAQWDPGAPSNNPSLNMSRICRDFTLSKQNDIILELDLFETYKPYSDTLQFINSNLSSIAIYPKGNDITLQIDSNGILTNYYNLIHSQERDSANQISILKTINDGLYIYRLAKIVVASKDSIYGLKLNKGDNLILIKSSFSGIFQKAILIGRGILSMSYSYQNLSIDSIRNILYFGITFNNGDFLFNENTPIPTGFSNGIYIAKYHSISLNRLSHQIIGKNLDYLTTLQPILNNGSWFLIARSSTSPISFNGIEISHDIIKHPFIIVTFDSIDNFISSEVIKSSHSNKIGTISAFGDQYYGIGSNLIDSKGNIYFNGAFTDSILMCKGSLKTITSLNLSGSNLNDGFIIKVKIRSTFIDTTICSGFRAPSNKILPDSNGVYFDTIPSSYGCDSIICIKLTVLISKSKIDTVICKNYTSPSGKYHLDSNGTILDTLSNQFGCDSIIRINVIKRKNSSIIDTFNCTKITTIKGLTYFNDTIVNETIPTFNTCDSIITYRIHIGKSYLNIDTSVCHSFTSPSKKYIWYTSGNYLDTISTAKGCDSIISVRLKVLSTYKQIDTSICGWIKSPSGKYLINKSGVYFDTLQNVHHCDSLIELNVFLNSYLDTLEINTCDTFYTLSGKKYFSNGTYFDTIHFANGKCDSIYVLKVSLNSFNIELQKSNDLNCDKHTSELTTNEGYMYKWKPNLYINRVDVFNPIVSPILPSYYYVTVSNTFNCKVTDSIFVDVVVDSINIELPNVFTPNGDNINDKICPNKNNQLSNFTFTIYNRWGEVIYILDNKSECWNGTDQNGTSLTEGTYFYTLKGVTICNKPIDISSTILLIK